MINDIHTHHSDRKGAIINASLNDFRPTDGFFYSMGIHPWHIKNYDIKTALLSLREHINEYHQIVAIGECGLDSLTDTPLNTQINVFEQHIALSEQIKKPLIIHCVRSSNELLNIYRTYTPQMPWIIHGFRSNKNVLRPFLDIPNIYISVGENFNHEAVKAIPDNRLLLETDESNLSIEEIAKQVAEVRNQPVQNVLDTTYENNKTALFLK